MRDGRMQTGGEGVGPHRRRVERRLIVMRVEPEVLSGLELPRGGVRSGRIVAVFVGVVFVLLCISLLSFPSIGRF